MACNAQAEDNMNAGGRDGMSLNGINKVTTKEVPAFMCTVQIMQEGG